MKSISIVFFLIFIFSSTVKSQDTLRLLNGNVLIVEIGEVGQENISFLLYNKGKKSFAYREKSLIFSFTKKDKNEVVVYKFNPDIGNIYNENEMRDYLVGERHADKYYKSRLYNYVSFAGGVGAGYLLSDNKLLAVLAPFVFSSIIIIPQVKVKRNELNETLITNGAYNDGYKRVAKGKKFLKSLKYGTYGMISSLLVFKLVD